MDKEEKELMQQSKELIQDYLAKYTLSPAMESLEKDIFVSLRLGNILVTLRVIQQLTGQMCFEPSTIQIRKHRIDKQDVVKKRLKSITDSNNPSEDDFKFLAHLCSQMCSKKCLLPFIENQVNWIVVSILCASYLSSTILMRSILELLINVVTTQNGGMVERIEGVPFILEYEKRSIKKTWDELCSWSHPYQKWLKNMCPHFLSYGPIHHEKHSKNCVNLLEKIMDIYLIVANKHFGMDIKTLGKTKAPIDLSAFPFFQSRMQTSKRQC